jgi:hypothetical protein
MVNSGEADFYKPKAPLRNALYKNNRDGTFTDVTDKAGVAGGREFGMGCAIADYDNDGYEDILVTAYGRCTLYHNNGNGTFSDVTAKSGLDKPGWTTSAVWFDYDNDGRLDLFVHNGHPLDTIRELYPTIDYEEPPLLFQNTGSGFREVAREHGEPLRRRYAGRGLAAGDYDNDGDTDLLLLNVGERPALLRNDGGNRRQWLGVALEGRKLGRDASGARVTLVAGGLRQTRTVLGGTSYCSVSDRRLLFGLGDTTRVERLEVEWPGGGRTVLQDLKAGRYLSVRE